MSETSSNATSPAPTVGDPEAPVDHDAHNRLQRLADVLRESTLHVVWRQWRALGAGASGRSARASAPDAGTGDTLHSLIDPEALVLISLVLLPGERRLADLLHDWAAKNSDLLSVQRMKNLLARYPDTVRRQLDPEIAWFATIARDAGKDIRWRAAAEAWTARGATQAPGAGRRSDSKKRATRARLNEGASLLLRLRLGIGVGIKADLIALLLARRDEWATIREIADATVYTPAAVRRAADDLAAARLIESREGQPAGYRAFFASWAPLLALDERPPQWASWHERFLLVASFMHWSEVARERPMSRYAFGVHGRELMEQHRRAFANDMVAVWSAHSPVNDWAAFIERSVQSMAGWMEEKA